MCSSVCSPTAGSLRQDDQNPRHDAFTICLHQLRPVGFGDFGGAVFTEVVEEGEEVFAFEADFGVVEGQDEFSVGIFGADFGEE